MSDAKEMKIRDWKHEWLNSCGWDAFAVWAAARWDPLEPEDRLAFVLGVCPYMPEYSISFNEHGDLIDDVMLMAEAYANDPEVPFHMVTPWVTIQGEGPF